MTTQQERLERFILGAIIWGKHPEYIERIIEDDFTNEHAKAVYVELLRRLKVGEDTSNTIMLSEEMTPHCVFISECSDVFDNSHDTELIINGEIDKLIRFSDLRNVYRGCQEIVRGIQSRDVDNVDKAIDELQLLQDTTLTRHEIRKDKLVGESMMEGFQQVDRNLSAGRIRMGFPLVDAFIGGGIQLGEFVVIGARTNVGKSIISLSPVIDTARRGKWVMLCSNEMTDAQMSLRMVANMSQVEMGVIEKIYNGSSYQYQAIATSSFELKKLPIIMKPDCFHVSDIVATLDERKRRGTPVSLVIVDYIQNMTSDNPRVNKTYDALSEVARALLGIAKRYNCVIIAMSQVNRSGEFADKIGISHLEGAGVIEQTADKIFLMYGGKQDKSVRYLELAKNRTGRVGDVPFEFTMDGARMKLTQYP